MLCPKCNNVTLVMSDRQGIEIDYCPQCRGVWLDKGELDKVIERSLSGVQSAEAQRPRSNYGERGRHYDEDYRRRKKRGFLGELFDFD